MYMYIVTSFLEYMAMDLIPILLGSLPLTHNAQHSLIIIMQCSPIRNTVQNRFTTTTNQITPFQIPCTLIITNINHTLSLHDILSYSTAINSTNEIRKLRISFSLLLIPTVQRGMQQAAQYHLGDLRE